MRGVIVKALSGFYYVRTDAGVLECKARGVFKKRGVSPLVGDVVRVESGPDGSRTVAEIEARSNAFERPPVANVSVMLVVCSAAEPAFDFFLADKLCISAQAAGAKPFLCVTKPDLAQQPLLAEIERVYRPLYPLFFVNGKTGEGAEMLRAALQGEQAALTGPSGAGKSTLTTRLTGQHAQTGEISEKSLRGKNTTRHSELFHADGFALFDTPGFTSFDVPKIAPETLELFFPEFAPYLGDCRFDDCRHLAEPDCAVRQALESGAVSERRYASYRELYAFMKEQEKY